MRTRILSFLLAGIMLFTALPAEAAVTVSPDEAAEAGLDYAGGMQLEAIDISDEMAEEIGILSVEDLTAGGQLWRYSNNYGSQQYSSPWDIYSSNYIYNRLDEEQRQFWDLLDAECSKYLTTTNNAKLVTVSDGAGGKTSCYASLGIEFLTLGLTSNKASNVYLMFLYANPQYYFLDSSYLRSSKSLTPVFYDKFANGSTRKAETQKMKANINEMKKQVEKGATDLEKAQIAHDLIIKKVQYDDEYDSDIPNTLYHQSAYSVFCDSYTVCAGYTKAFEILMNSVGIDVVGVTSRKVMGYDFFGNPIVEGHAWNAVCLNDTWYYVDCTWDDLDGEFGLELQYIWFGLSEATFTGPMDKLGFHTAESLYRGLLPKCSRDMGSTRDQVGTAYVPDQAAAAPEITQNRTSKGVRVTLSSKTPGADIYYTTDNSEPSASFSRSYHYTEPLLMNSDVTVKAIAVCDGVKDSEVAAAAVKGRQYTVKFDTNGGNKVSSLKVWPQDAVKKPDNPKKKDYQFMGWYSNPSCTAKWDFSNKVTGNMTLYAKWTKVKVKSASIKKLKKRGSRKLEVTIRKVSDAKGYQIRYSKKSSMKSAKKVQTSSAKKTISGLKAGTRYYVQVRAYKLDSTKAKIYGKWSKSKKVTTGK